MNRYSRIRWLTIAAVLILVISAGYTLIGGKEESQPIDPPQNVTADDPLYEAVQTAVNEIGMEFPVYFKDPDGYVVPLKIGFPKTEGTAKETLRYMVAGGPGESQLPAGFSALLPEGTEVLGMDINNGLAIVDFSKSFTQYAVADERKILEAITWSLTSFPTIDEVVLRVEGRSLHEMPVAGTPLDRPLSRSLGINLENPGGLRPTAAMPVTVYFQNQTGTNIDYFVPVTRLVEASEDVAMASLQELIKGPSDSAHLQPVLNPSIQIIDLKEGEGIITVNFSEEFTGLNQTVSSEAVQTVVLSLTDNLAADLQVQILVDGTTQFQDATNRTFEKPVSRPVFVNDLSF